MAGAELRVVAQDAAIGGFGGVVLAGFFGQFGGEQGVGRRFRRELEGFKQIVGGCGGIGVAIDARQGAPGAGFECGTGLAGIESGSGDEFGAGLVQLVLAGEKQAQRDVRLKRFGIGGDGAAIESGSVVEAILRIGHVAGVEEGAGVGGMGGEPWIQFGFGGLPVGSGDSSLGGGELIGNTRRFQRVSRRATAARQSQARKIARGRRPMHIREPQRKRKMQNGTQDPQFTV